MHTLTLTLSNHANACTSPSQSKSCSWRNANGEPVTCAPRRCVTLLFRCLLEASANTEHVFTWLNTNGHPRAWAPSCSTLAMALHKTRQRDSASCSCISSITMTIYKIAWLERVLWYLYMYHERPIIVPLHTSVCLIDLSIIRKLCMVVWCLMVVVEG